VPTKQLSVQITLFKSGSLVQQYFIRQVTLHAAIKRSKFTSHQLKVTSHMIYVVCTCAI